MTWFELSTLITSVLFWFFVLGLLVWQAYQRRLVEDLFIRRSQHYNQLLEAYCEQQQLLAAANKKLSGCQAEYERLRDYPPPPSTDADGTILRRAVRLVIFALYDEKTHVPTAADPMTYIGQAKREIEREQNGSTS
jgi:hypothetical protein